MTERDGRILHLSLLVCVVGSLSVVRSWRGRVDLSDADLVQVVLLCVELSEGDPEDDASNKGGDGKDAVVPDEERVRRQRQESFAKGVGNGSGEEEDSHDHGLHVSGCLGEGVLETGDRCKELRQCDEDVRGRLSPHIDRSWDRCLGDGIFARGSLVTARAQFVDVRLQDGSRNHGKGSHEETGADSLQRGEVEAHFAEEWVDTQVEDGNQNQNGQRVQVGDQIVGQTVKFHNGGLGGQIVVDLVVAEPVHWEENKYLAGLDSSTELINPDIVESHPSRRSASLARRLCVLPQISGVELLAGSNGVQVPSALGCVTNELEGLAEDGAGGRGLLVPLAADGKNREAQEEDDRREQVGQPETNALLCVDHGDLADDGADVDGGVEVHEQTCNGESGVNDDTLTRLERLNGGSFALDLFGNEGGAVGLEEARANAHDDDGNHEGAECAIRVVEDGGSS